MKIGIIFLFSVVTFLAAGQSTSSLLVQEAIEQSDNHQNPNESLEVLGQVAQYISKVPDTLKANYFLEKAIAFGKLGNNDSSFFYLEQCEYYAKLANEISIQVGAKNVRGLVYMGMAKYDESLLAYQSALKLIGEKQDSRSINSITEIYGNMGGIYYQLQDFSKAMEVTQKALEIAQNEGNIANKTYNLLRLALIYNDLDSLDQSISYLRNATVNFETLNDTIMLLYSENTLGKIYQRKMQSDSALLHFQIAERLAKSIGAQEEVAFTMLSVASLFLELSDIKHARNKATEVLVFSIENSYPNSQKQAYDLLYLIALEENQPDQALKYRNQYYQLSDSLSGVEMKSRVAELETKFETAEKEAEIEKLALSNELKTANLERSRNANYAMAIGAFSLLVLIIVYFTLRHKRQKLDQEAQQLRIEALQKRLMELNATPPDLHLDMSELNSKLQSPLSEREFETLRLSVDGKSNAEIADKLFISVSTVKFHLTKTYSKLGVSNRKEALDYVVKKN